MTGIYSPKKDLTIKSKVVWEVGLYSLCLSLFKPARYPNAPGEESINHAYPRVAPFPLVEVITELMAAQHFTASPLPLQLRISSVAA